MTYGMALELAPDNIRVNCVAPGAVEGDRIDRVIAGPGGGARHRARGHAQGDARALAAQADGDRRRHRRRRPLFLCSDLARNISGQVLPVNAGEPAG